MKVSSTITMNTNEMVSGYLYFPLNYFTRSVARLIVLQALKLTFFVCTFYILFSSGFVQATNVSGQLNFTPTQRQILTDNQFIEALVKSAGTPVISSSTQTNQNQTINYYYQFQKNTFAPLTLSFNQDRLSISWDIPKASTSELYQANSENKRTMINLLSYLFGNSQLINLMLSNENNRFQFLSANGLWRIEFNKNHTQHLLIISPI